MLADFRWATQVERFTALVGIGKNSHPGGMARVRLKGGEEVAYEDRVVCF